MRYEKERKMAKKQDYIIVNPYNKVPGFQRKNLILGNTELKKGTKIDLQIDFHKEAKATHSFVVKIGISRKNVDYQLFELNDCLPWHLLPENIAIDIMNYYPEKDKKYSDIISEVLAIIIVRQSELLVSCHDDVINFDFHFDQFRTEGTGKIKNADKLFKEVEEYSDD